MGFYDFDPTIWSPESQVSTADLGSYHADPSLSYRYAELVGKTHPQLADRFKHWFLIHAAIPVRTLGYG